jgi:monovalent cation/hydrogen antiporter
MAEEERMSGAAGLQEVETVFLLLMALIAVFAIVARRLEIPYPIVLVIAGLGIGLVPGLPHPSLNPDVVFLVILPPLLYSSAWTMSQRAFRFNLVGIALLAVGLVAFTVWGVAEFADRFIPGLGWKAGFLLGAVVSPTDAIAATSIATRLGLPRSITDVLEGESLVNDATGLLALELGLKIIRDNVQTPTVGEGVLRLLWLIFAGTGIGLAAGVAGSWMERWVDDGPVEIVISLVIPYATYLAANWANASGVLAVVACALYMSPKSAVFFSARTRIQVNATWEALTFVLNGIVFVLIGLQLPYVVAGIRGAGVWGLILWGTLFSLVLILLRVVWVYPGAELTYQIRKRVLKQKIERRGARAVFVVGWTGMRGVVALAAAISLPNTLNGQPFVEKNLIVFLTFTVILVTLVGQGLTLPPLIRVLGLEGDDSARLEEEEARRLVLREVIAQLEQGKDGDAELADTHAYEDLLHQYGHRLEALSEDSPEGDAEGHRHSGGRFGALLRSAVETERQTMLRLWHEGRISDEVLRTLEYELDLTESRANLGGLKA